MQEVTGREDSETYAKRTITEIETCLGFTFHGAAGPAEPEAPPEAISTNELEVRMHVLRGAVGGAAATCCAVASSHVLLTHAT